MKLSNRQVRKLARKRKKQAAKAEHALRVTHRQTKTQGFTTLGGKEARARAARTSFRIGQSTQDNQGGKRHRASGGAPINDYVLPEHQQLVNFLESIETHYRTKFYPKLVIRNSVPMDCHGALDIPLSHEAAAAQQIYFQKAELFTSKFAASRNLSYQPTRTFITNENNHARLIKK